MSPSRGDEFQGRRQQVPGTLASILTVMPVILLLMLGYVLWQGFYTVDAYQEAVVMRFGRFHSTQGPGLHFKVPLVDKAILVDTAEKSRRLPYSVGESTGSAARIRRQDESLILTGDLYAGVVEWNVIWRVADPKDFLFSINDLQVENVITAVARSVMHRIVGDYSADEILTSERARIGERALEEMQGTLQSYQSGIAIIDLQMQRVIPPDRVRAAFDQVNASIQERDQKVNEAKQERNGLIPKAEASSDKLIREAEGYAARRRAEANGEISALLAKYREYKLAPEVTRERLYLETMERVIENSGPKTVMDGDLPGLLPLLNLDSTNAATTGQ
jgi:membrane protease subunit HflK